MSFISFEFVILFIICFLTYYVVRKEIRKYVLLVASCVFIGYFNLWFLVTALFVSTLSYSIGLMIEKARTKGHSQTIYWGGICFLILCWFIFRHADSITGNSSFIFPLGISFYTFQAIAYLTEVYWEEERAERNLFDFTLYMLLFMKFISGPIERPADLLPQIKELRPATYSMMSYGLKLIVVGLIKKLILADHIAPYIDEIFNSVYTASGAQLLMACLLYPVELYADFSGYTDMAIGGAMLFGLRLAPNFNRPFVAQTTTDFWRRWHISLSSWVRDYLYIPLTSITRSLTSTGILISLLVTFVALGMWHGIGWNFVIYGLIQGIVIVWELKTQTIRKIVSHKIGQRFYAFLSGVRTYIIFALSLVFFKAATVQDAFYFIKHISLQTNASWKEINIGMSDHICIVAGSALLLMLLYEYGMSRRDMLQYIESRPIAVRWTIYYLSIFAILAYGKLGAENFIYLQF